MHTLTNKEEISCSSSKVDHEVVDYIEGHGHGNLTGNSLIILANASADGR